MSANETPPRGMMPGIEADALTAQLTAAREHRDHVDRVIAWLEDGVELLGGPAAAIAELPPPPPDSAGDAEDDADHPAPPPDPIEPEPLEADEPPPPATPPVELAGARSTTPTRSRASGRDYRGKVLHVLVKTNTALKFAEIHAQVGGSVPHLRKTLQQLVKDQRIEATGATASRRYKGRKPDEFHTEARTRQEAAKTRNAEKVADGVDRVVFRDKVAKAIAADAGLTVVQLSCQLSADVDDVAEACSWLVEHRQARQEGDGYVRHTAGRARLRAA